MIFLVTPQHILFRDWLRIHGLPRDDKFIIHINHPHKLMGIRISQDDKVIYYLEYLFEPECLSAIRTELLIRGFKENDNQ